MEQALLKEIIKISNVSNQKDFSKLTGVPETRISEWLNGKKNPKIATLNKIAEGLGIKIEFKVTR